jgi:molybdate transport system substrate-binding protein
MVNPIKQMADILEKELDINIVLTQGGSADLYNALKKSNIGDIYISGSTKYIDEKKNEGLFEEYMKIIGYNQAAIFVQKNNPHQIKSLKDFLREDISTMLCDPNTGSIGKMSKLVFENYKGERFFEEVYLSSVAIGTDSRNINTALKKEEIDAAINWRSTISFNDHTSKIDMVKIDEKYAPKVNVPAVLLKSSKQKEVAKRIIDFMVTPRGEEIMRKYGFL